MMPRKLWAEEIALAMCLRDCGWDWEVVATEVGSRASTIKRAVTKARRHGYDAYPSRFGRTM